MEWKRFFTYLIFILSILLTSKLSYQRKIDYRFCTRTPYRHIENNDINIGNYPGCEQLKIWMLVRHGSRLPSQDIIDFMVQKLPFIRDIIVDNHTNYRGGLTQTELDRLKIWKPNVTLDDKEKILVNEGERELYQLGQRTYQRFANITNTDFDRIKFRTTPTQRAIMSAKFFAKGMFMDNDKVNIQVSPDKGDKVLRFYKTCDKWYKYVKRNDNTYNEVKSYVETEEMKRSLSELSFKMGVKTPIAYNMAKQIYETCGYETAWSSNDTVSPWCALFSNSSIKPFEYADDIKHYWLDGYGSSLTKRLPCKLLDDIVNLFKSNSTSAFYFTHSGTLLKALAFFGLHEPVEELRHDSRDANRPWRTTLIDAFASNIAFVLYKCGEELKFLVLHQERPIHLPECDKEEDLCPLDVLINKNKSTMCNLDEMCSLNRKDEL